MFARHQWSHISKATVDGGRRNHCWRHYVRSCAHALSAAKVPVGGRGATFTTGNQVAVYPDTHRTTGVHPFQPGSAEHFVEAFRFRLAFDA
jgi:hypothetical protein